MRAPTIHLLALAAFACAAVTAGEAAADPVGLRGAQTLEARPAPPPAAQPKPSAPPARRARPSGPDHTVQIGVFTSVKIAQERWARIGRSFGPSQKGRRLRIIPIELNGRRAYRARIAGFPSRAVASRFCAELSREGQACFVPPARR